jgi:hypothetical protein
LYTVLAANPIHPASFSSKKHVVAIFYAWGNVLQGGRLLFLFESPNWVTPDHYIKTINSIRVNYPKSHNHHIKTSNSIRVNYLKSHNHHIKTINFIRVNYPKSHNHHIKTINSIPNNSSISHQLSILFFYHCQNH